MAHEHDAHGHDHHEDHGGLAKYGFVFIALCALTGCSFMTTSSWWTIDKAPTWIFMMGVSCAKAMLVIMFFMHLLWEANWKYVLTIPAAMMSCFLVLMLIPDVGLRGNWYSEERTVYAAAKDVAAETEHGDEHAEHSEEHGSGDAHAPDAGHAEHAEDGHATEAKHKEGEHAEEGSGH